MNRTSKGSGLILLLSMVATCAHGARDEEPAATSAKETTSMPAEFVAGSYDVIGRYPDSDQPYIGTMTIDLPATGTKSLSITRVIGGATRQGSGAFATTADGVAVLRIQFEDEHGALEATYLVGSDLDNYARLTGYVYAKDGDTRLPGLEALFHDHYKDR